MENLHIIVLSAIVSILFLVFILATYKEIQEMDQIPFDGNKEGGPRAELLNLIGHLIDEKLERKEK
ncbi:MAG: hypothetical protein IPH78_14105 [Bacteroidetes bacterium]|nr:hypothetical protein [Bacteroidota bacterium]MBK8659221.1 hypothetical protein [Bacteroidota bacterium]